MRPLNYSLILAFGLTLWVGACTRPLSVAPLPASLYTRTPTFTDTPSRTVTPTFTSTLTLSPTPTSTATLTRTSTGVPTSTSTTTRTSTNTSTLTFTATSTDTPLPAATSTSTDTMTNTNTPTITPTATFTPCYPASVQTTYTFDSSVDCWGPATGAQPYVPFYGIDNTQVNQGSNALHIAVDNSTGSPQNIQMNVTYASPMDLSGMMLVAMVYVDPTLAPSDYSGAIQPFDQSGPNWGAAVWEDQWITVNAAPPANVGAWFPVTLIFGSGAGDPTQVLQFGIQLTGVPAGASGNFYIDDLQILPVPPVATPTATMTDTPAGCGYTYPMGVVQTVTPVAPICYTEMESVGSGGPTGTNENCGAAENVGTINSGNIVEIKGSLAVAGNTGADYDWANDDIDYYVFTTGPTGDYTVTLDSYTDGTIYNDFDVYIFNATCGAGPSSWGSDPVEALTPAMLGPLAGGTQFIVAVVGWNGLPQSPYRITISTP